MADDKIKIDWDDINRPEVEARVEHERRLRIAAAHYQRDQQGAAVDGRVYGTISGGQVMGASGGSSAMQVLYKPWIHAGLAGLVLAFISWAITEPIPYFSSNGADLERKLVEYLEQKGYTLLSLSQESAPTQEAVIEQFRRTIRTGIYMETMLWFGIIGAAIGAGLCSAEHFVGRAYEKALRGALIGIGVGFLGGAIAGGVAQYLYASLTSMNAEASFAAQVMARGAGWGLAGLMLGAGQGIAMGSAKKVRNGLMGGLLGGLLGGALFDPIANALQTGWASRMVALCVIGAATGVLIGLVEAVLKEAWLLVTAGPLAGKQFIIYRNPTVFGSSPKADIYLFKDPSVEPRHAALYVGAGWYELEDQGTPHSTLVNGRRIGRQRLRHDDNIQIGQYAFSYAEKRRARN